MPSICTLSEHQLLTSLTSPSDYAAQLVQLLNLARWFLLFQGVQLIPQHCILLSTTMKVLCMGDMEEPGSWQGRPACLICVYSVMNGCHTTSAVLALFP